MGYSSLRRWSGFAARFVVPADAGVEGSYLVEVSGPSHAESGDIGIDGVEIVLRVAVAAVGLVDHLYTGVALHVLADDIWRTIGRTVVDADDLDVLERLRHGGIEALAQVALNIADGNKQRNFRGIRVLQENLLLNSV